MTTTTLNQLVTHARAGPAARLRVRAGIQRRLGPYHIDYMLVEWGRNPNQFDRDEVSPPSSIAIQNAVQAAHFVMKD